MQHITTGSDRLLGAVDEISNALREQGSTSTLIAEHVEKISQMTEENGTAIASVAKAANELSRLSQELQHNVNRFVI